MRRATRRSRRPARRRCSAGRARRGAAGPPAEAPPARAAPTAAEIAAAAEVLVTRRTRGQIAAAVVWNSMIAISILLALVTIAIVIVGITGGHL